MSVERNANNVTVDCRLIRVRNTYCEFREAEETFHDAQKLVKKLQDQGCKPPSLAGLYSEFCALYFVKSQYDEVRFGFVFELGAFARVSAGQKDFTSCILPCS